MEVNRGANGGQTPDPRHLLGGYASGTLTPSEQQFLFEAALADPQLFEELMKEQALREALAEPGVRRELIASLESKPSVWTRLAEWMRSPVAWSAAGAVAAAVLVVVFVGRTPSPVQAPVSAPVVTELRLEQQAALPEKEKLPEPKRTAAAPAPAAPKPLERKKVTPQVGIPARQVILAEKREMEAPALPAAPQLESAVVTGGAAPLPAPTAANMADAVVAERRVVQPLEYAILRGDEAGVFRPLASTAELGDSDRFKITVTSRNDGMLTLSRRTRDRRLTVISRSRVVAGATVILPAEDSIRVSDVESVVLQLGDAAESARPGLLGFSAPGAITARGRAKQAAEADQTPVIIEIPIRRRR